MTPPHIPLFPMEIMMPKLSQAGVELLSKCHPDLRKVFNEAINYVDFTILPSTIRTVEQQKEFVATGKSKTMNSKHLAQPLSHAVDVAPFPVLWPDEKGILRVEAEHRLKRFHVFAGFILGLAIQMGIDLRWGGDWDEDWIYNDQSFHDLPHFELKI